MKGVSVPTYRDQSQVQGLTMEDLVLINRRAHPTLCSTVKGLVGPTDLGSRRRRAFLRIA